jgi:Zn-dependent peptidase ImmA (M78 family)
MNWSDAHRAAMVAAADAQEELQLDTFQRVDVFDAMASAGLRVIFRKLDGCAALYLPSSLGGRPGAIINASHPLALQRYSAAHETGHHFFGHSTQVTRDAEPQRATVRLSAQEMLAEAFAAWFLMPPEGVEQALASMHLTHPRSPADVYGLSLRVGTSYQATCVHLPNLKLLHARKSTEWSKLSLKDIKQHLSGHGIWVLSPADKDRTIVVRAGDRLLLDVADADVQMLPPGASSTILRPAELLNASRVEVDLSPDTDAGPANILLEQDGQTIEFALNVERPRNGRYVPVRKVTA